MRPRPRPERYAAQAERNRAYFRTAVAQGLELNAAMPVREPVKPLGPVSKLKARLKPIFLPPGFIPKNHWPCNPSVVRHEGRLLANVRCVNYHLLTGRVPPPHTVNLVVSLSEDLTTRDVWRLHEPSQKIRGYGCCEDIRLFSLGRRLAASATVVDAKARRVDIALLDIDYGFNITRVDIQDTGSARQEKNWMPVVTGEGLRWIYSVDPTVVRMPGKLISETKLSTRLGDLRGSSQLLETLGGYLAVIHEALPGPSVINRVYTHRFVSFNRDLEVTGVSSRFCFKSLGVEFCAGMTRHRGKLVLSFGVNDAEAWLAEVDEIEAVSMLKPLEDFE